METQEGGLGLDEDVQEDEAKDMIVNARVVYDVRSIPKTRLTMQGQSRNDKVHHRGESPTTTEFSDRFEALR